MTRQQPTKIDEIAVNPWIAIQSEAAHLRKEEPLLAGIISKLAVEEGTLAQALAAKLGELLAAPGLSAETLAVLFRNVMAADPAVEASAARDLRALRDKGPACTSYLHALLNFKGFQALQAHRIAHRLWLDGRQEVASWIANRASLVLGPDIHPAARIGSEIMLDHGSGIVIGETAVIDDNASIMQNVTLGGTGKISGDRHPKVRQGVLIGAGATVLGNVEIGAFSKVAAGSVVLKSVPPGCTVAGIPAQIVRIHAASERPAKTMNHNI